MATEHNDYYCYVLFRENGKPFYVGKGRLGRCRVHITKAKKGHSHKDNIICAMLDAGLDVPTVRVATGLTNDQAVAAERAFISALGREPDRSVAAQKGGDRGD